MKGHPGQSGAHTITTEVPYDKPAKVYERNALGAIKTAASVFGGQQNAGSTVG